MTPSEINAPFTLKRVQEMLGLSRTIVAGLISAGFVTPARGRRNEYRFTFRDLMLLRTAYALEQARIPPRKILRSLTKLKTDLPVTLPLTGLRITAVGANVAVRDRSGQWDADSGQLLMDFEVAPIDGGVSFIKGARTNVPQPSAEQRDWFNQAVAMEATDTGGAMHAYTRAIEADPCCAPAYLNFGALLCEQARCEQAVALYEVAIKMVGHDPNIHFNHAMALEDLRRTDEAIVAYERAIALDANFGDAHYNCGVLLENRGDAKGALRHFNAYRRLQQRGG